MKNKPIFVNLMSLLFIALAIALPFQILVLFKLMPWDFSLIYSKLTPLNLILMISFTSMAVLTHKMNKNVYTLLPVITFLVFLNNYIVAEYGQLFSHVQTSTGSIIFLCLILTFYKRDFVNVFKNKHFRWWLSAPRKKQNFSIIVINEGVDVQSSTYDLSESGIFIIDDDSFSVFNLKKGSEIKINLKMPSNSIELVAKIVRKSFAKGVYPSGIGVQILKSKSPGYDNFKSCLEAA